MKIFYVVIHGHIGRLLDAETDCEIAKNKKDAISICELDEYGDKGYVTLELPKNTPETEIKKKALQEIW